MLMFHRLHLGALFLVLVLLVGILPMPASAAPPPVPTPQSPGYATQFGEVISTLTPTLQWSSVSGANNYHVAIRQYSGSWDSGPIVLDKGYIYSTSYSVPSGVLEAGASYRWNVEAYNSAGETSGWSSRLYFQTQSPPTIPGAPTGLTATTISESQINLVWNTPSGSPTNYKIYRGTSCGGLSLIYTTSTSGTTFQNTAGLNQGTTYCYSVSAVNGAGEGSKSSTASATTSSTTSQLPGAPSGLSPGSSSNPGPTVSSLTPTLSWSASSGNPSYYGVYVSQPPYGSPNLIIDEETGSVTSPSYTIPSGKLSCGVTYKWNLRAYNSAGWSGFSSALYFTAPDCQTTTTPSAPTSAPNLQSPGHTSAPGEAQATTTPMFSWSSVSGATSYNLYISKAPYGEANQVRAITGISGTSHTLTGIQALPDNTDYRWTATGSNSGGEGPYSTQYRYFRVQTPEAPPEPPAGPITLTNKSPDCTTGYPGVRLNWNAASGTNVVYDLYRDGSLNSARTGITGTEFYNGYSGGGLDAGSTYEYKITARNSGGSIDSNTLNVEISSVVCTTTPSPSPTPRPQDTNPTDPRPEPPQEPQEHEPADEGTQAASLPFEWQKENRFTLQHKGKSITATSIAREHAVATKAWIFQYQNGAYVTEGQTHYELTRAAYVLESFLMDPAMRNQLQAFVDLASDDASREAWTEGGFKIAGYAITGATACVLASGAAAATIVAAPAAGLTATGCVVIAGIAIGGALLIELASDKIVDFKYWTMGGGETGNPDLDSYARDSAEHWRDLAIQQGRQALAASFTHDADSLGTMWAAYLSATAYGVTSYCFMDKNAAIDNVQRGFELANDGAELLHIMDGFGESAAKYVAGLKLVVELSQAEGEQRRFLECIGNHQAVLDSLNRPILAAAREGAEAIQRITGQYPAAQSVVVVPLATRSVSSPGAAAKHEWATSDLDGTKNVEVTFVDHDITVSVDSSVHHGQSLVLSFDSATDALATFKSITAINSNGDRVTVTKASNMADVENPFDDGDNVEYWIENNNWYELHLSFPHFSQWIVEIRQDAQPTVAIEDAGQAFVTPLGISLMGAGALLVGGVAYGLGRRRERNGSGLTDAPRVDESRLSSQNRDENPSAAAQMPKPLLAWSIVLAIPGLVYWAVAWNLRFTGSQVENIVHVVVAEQVQRLGAFEGLMVSVAVAGPVALLVSHFVARRHWMMHRISKEIEAAIRPEPDLLPDESGRVFDFQENLEDPTHGTPQPESSGAGRVPVQMGAMSTHHLAELAIDFPHELDTVSESTEGNLLNQGEDSTESNSAEDIEKPTEDVAGPRPGKGISASISLESP